MNVAKSNASSILIIEPNQDSLTQLIALIEPVGLKVMVAQTGEQALNVIEKLVPAIIFLNSQLPGIGSFETCYRLKQHQNAQAVPILFIKDIIEKIDYRKILSLGCVGMLTKPFQSDEVLMHIHVHITQDHPKLELEIERLKQENKQLKLKLKSLQSAKLTTAKSSSLLLGQSQPMIALLNLIRCVANSDLSILIEGECGTGKELVAHIIHDESAYAKGPFVAVNCATIPSELAESTLFGAMRGAFTGAVNDHKGYFELAEGGTLFLDEIGEMPGFLQTKLLRVLEERKIWPVGATKLKSVNIRIITATNANLLSMIEAGTFRYDLYSRLTDDIITTPPLRTHKEDIALLIEHFLDQLASEPAHKKLSQAALTVLENYDFPGNVRELKNMIRRAWCHCKGQTIQPEHLRLHAPAVKSPNSKSQQILPVTPNEVLESVQTEYFILTDEQKILALTQKLGYVNNVLCQQLLDFNHDQAKYILRKMICNSMLVREKSNRATIYRLPSPYNNRKSKD